MKNYIMFYPQENQVPQYQPFNQFAAEVPKPQPVTEQKLFYTGVAKASAYEFKNVAPIIEPPRVCRIV